MTNILLPRQDNNGNYYISYSQISGWNAAKGFNTGLQGKQEYIRSYFLGENFPSGPFATFGKEVENYITENKDEDKFTDEELLTLNKIRPIGIFQKEFRLKYNGFYVLGYIDDCDEELTHLRDYKTGSSSSVKKYYESSYEQLDIYALAARQITGKLPNKLEVCAIGRAGNGFKEGRGALKVTGDIWYIERKTDEQRLNTIEANIQRTVQEISHTYKVFLKLNK